MKEPRRQLTQLEKYGLPAIVVVIGFFAYLKLSYDPMVDKKTRLEREIASTEVSIKTLERSNLDSQLGKVDAEYRKVESLYASAEKDLEEMKKIVASGPEDRSEMLNEISTLADNKYGLKISDFEVAGAGRSGTNKAEEVLGEMYHYKTVIIGSFFNLNRFFKDIVRVKGKLVLVDKVEMTKSLVGDELCRAVVEFSL